MNEANASIAVLVPCLNEESTIGKVVAGFRSALPHATIYVYDNGSSDHTVAQAHGVGAVVRSEPLRGKGNVVRRMFADVDADIYVLVDGDDTYHAESAPLLVEMLAAGQFDMVTGSRIPDAAGAYPLGHRFGNLMLTRMVAAIFGNRVSDMLSGYRVFSRRFVKSFPALSRGFEIETEFTVHALELSLPLGEMATPYRERPAGSTSKLSTVKDGLRILLKIIRLIKEERPLQFFSGLAVMLATASVVLSLPLFATYIETGLVPRFPTAILSVGLMILAFLGVMTGLILSSVALGRKELKRLHYLLLPASCVAARRSEGQRDAKCVSGA